MNLLALAVVISSVLAVALLIVLDMLRKARVTLKARDRSLDVFQQRLSREMAKREAAEHALATTDTRDTETGAASQARFLASGEEELRRASRYGRALAVLFVAPQEGADLAVIAAAIAEGLRDSDLLGRLDGEKLAVLLPETAQETAEQVAKRIAEPGPDLGDAAETTRGCRVGCAGLEPTDESFDGMIERARAGASA